MAPAKLLGLLVLLVVCLSYVHSGKSKKTIKIHVPYYVKHIHHYKKVYVPKVSVVKHEHLHKKEHEHHHHHDHHEKHHHHPYDKSSVGGYYDDYDSYYDDIDHRSYNDGGNGLSKSKQPKSFRPTNVPSWRDQRSSEEAVSSSEEDDYISGSEDEGTLPAPLPGPRYRTRPTVSSNFRKILRKRIDIGIDPTPKSSVFISPSVKTRIIGRITST